ncbi:MAG: PDDEXK nuclease domain-containing protein [Christensenellaceae bacterium]|jgi:predicted nuclease of restriction endonuclease-like (RecB) superfamily|nr:PDDEXK nuclease domain-containing protein [Christensenellaceae bacterium]
MLLNNKDYFNVLADIKNKIREAQHRAFFSVNKELILLYWNIGKVINDKSVWGNKFIENLERDIKLEFPKAKGFSIRNLKYMAKFAKEFDDLQIVQQVVAQLPWGQNRVLLDKLNDKGLRLWYATKTKENGWSRVVLEHQIESNLYQRQVIANKADNFKNTLPSPQSDLVKQSTKDPYIFDFISNADDLYETQIERALIDNIAKLLLELGTGFAFLGNQYHIEVENEDYYLDMLFYNIQLNCFVVVELKNTDFKPEYAGKLNFYVSAVDSTLKRKTDNPTIGLLLCKNKKTLTAEYALRNIKSPIGVSEYKLSKELPKEFANVLPSVADIVSRIDIKGE